MESEDLEGRLKPGSKVFDQPIFRIVFEEMRRVLPTIHPSLKSITDLQLFWLLRYSKGDRNKFTGYIRNSKKNSEMDDGVDAKAVYGYIKQQVLDNESDLRDYLDSLPKGLNEGLVSYTTRISVPTYEAFVSERESVPTLTQEKEDYQNPIIGPDLSEFFKPKPREQS